MPQGIGDIIKFLFNRPTSDMANACSNKPAGGEDEKGV